MPGIKIELANETIEFGVTDIPNRKSKALYKTRGTTLDILAYFRNDECADEFMEGLDKLIAAFN